MKKLIILSVLALIGFSCEAPEYVTTQNEEVVIPPNQNPNIFFINQDWMLGFYVNGKETYNITLGYIDYTFNEGEIQKVYSKDNSEVTLSTGSTYKISTPDGEFYFEKVSNSSILINGKLFVK